jgi:hypothetical protein
MIGLDVAGRVAVRMCHTRVFFQNGITLVRSPKRRLAKRRIPRHGYGKVTVTRVFLKDVAEAGLA